MKKFFYSILAAATMLFATTSCSQDEEIVNGGPVSGNTQKVTFKVEMPGETASRTLANGAKVGQANMANKLAWALYESTKTDGTPVATNTATKDPSSNEFTVNIDMVKGLEYKVLFLAYNEGGTIFDVAAGDDLKSLNFKSGLVSNNEAYDAFVACHTHKVNNETVTSVTLKRPFAQVNVGTTDTDLTKAANLQATVVESQLVINGVPTQYNVLTDEATVPQNVTVTFAKSAILYNADGDNETLANVDGRDYNYLNMVYVLAGEGTNTSSTHTATYTFYRTNDATPIRTIEVENLPLERNYRTNIVGDIITQTESFKVIIDSNFEGDHTNKHFEKDATGTYHVTSAEGLIEFMEKVNAGDSEMTGATVTLDGDIDLSALASRSAVASNWTPIGTSEKPFTGTFNGQGYTIKNLALVEAEAKEGKAYIGFFGYAKDATIKDVTFENVYINIPCLDIDHSQGHIGAVAGSLEGTSTIENVTVKGDIKVYATQDANGASRVAVVAGGNSYGNVTMKNVHVIANEGSYLIANNNTGALAGQLQAKSVFENCSSNIDVTVNKFFAGGIIGLAAGDQLFVNCHTTGNISVVAGREGKAHDHYRVGGIAGGWADGKNNVCTLEGCSYTGTISGTNADGSVAEKFDYMGYVGRGYTLNGCQGSKVVIDGTEFVQKYNTAAEAGVYEISDAEGNAAVGSKEDLPKDGDKINTNFNENITLIDDITVSSKETTASSGYGATGVKVSNGAILDGQGNTLTVNDAWGTWDCVVAATGGTIKNLTVNGAMRGIFMPGADADVFIENVIFNNVIYTFNSDAGNKNYGVYISNSTLNGWTSHSDVHKEVIYTNCKFGEGNGYAFCRPYGPTSFVNCAFEAGFEVEAIGKISFENCTIGGVALTAENLSTLVIANIENATVK